MIITIVKEGISNGKNKFDGGLMGLEYYIYYCEECRTDFAVKSSSEVVCCLSCKSENVIRGDVTDFC